MSSLIKLIFVSEMNTDKELDDILDYALELEDQSNDKNEGIAASNLIFPAHEPNATTSSQGSSSIKLSEYLHAD